MKEFNFNTIKNLSVPEQWIENALLIPEAEDHRLAVIPLTNRHCEESAEPTTRLSQPFWRKPRFIAMAASLMLVTALSIALFLSMGNKPPVSVKSDAKPDATQIVWSTDKYGATVATEIVVVTNDGNQSSTQPTEKKSSGTRFRERVFGDDDPTSPTTPSGQGGSARTSLTPPRDQRGSAPSATEHDRTSQPPSPVTPSPTIAPPPIETVSPRETEVDPPVEQPTIAPWEPPTVTPWMPPSEEPTEPPIYYATITSAIFKPTYGLGEKDTIPVYCKILSSNRSILYGDDDLYSEQHRAIITANNSGTLKFSYTPADHGILPADGKYYYEFYDENGRRLSHGIMHLRK